MTETPKIPDTVYAKVFPHLTTLDISIFEALTESIIKQLEDRTSEMRIDFITKIQEMDKMIKFLQYAHQISNLRSTISPELYNAHFRHIYDFLTETLKSSSSRVSENFKLGVHEFYAGTEQSSAFQPSAGSNFAEQNSQSDSAELPIKQIETNGAEHIPEFFTSSDITGGCGCNAPVLGGCGCGMPVIAGDEDEQNDEQNDGVIENDEQNDGVIENDEQNDGVVEDERNDEAVVNGEQTDEVVEDERSEPENDEETEDSDAHTGDEHTGGDTDITVKPWRNASGVQVKHAPFMNRDLREIFSDRDYELLNL